MTIGVNRDGKLWDRVVAAAIPLSLGLSLAAIVWWRDTSNSNSRAADAITRIETRIDKVEVEVREARRNSAEDRQKMAELAADLRNVVRGVGRIETTLDKLVEAPQVPAQGRR